MIKNLLVVFSTFCSSLQQQIVIITKGKTNPVIKRKTKNRFCFAETGHEHWLKDQLVFHSNYLSLIVDPLYFLPIIIIFIGKIESHTAVKLGINKVYLSVFHAVSSVPVHFRSTSGQTFGWTSGQTSGELLVKIRQF